MERRDQKVSRVGAGPLRFNGTIMAAISSILIRRARRDDVGAIVRMLADDPLGSARERLEDPLAPCYFRAFEAVEQASNIQLVVAVDEDGGVIGCLHVCILR